MAGIAHLDRRRGNPGWKTIPITLRQFDHSDVVRLWTGREVQSFLDRNVIETNRLEGARNIVNVDARRNLAILTGDIAPVDSEGNEITDDELIFQAKVEAADELDAVIEDSRPALLEAFELADNPPLPTEPSRVRNIRLEEVESAATAKTQFIRGVFGEQGMDVSVPTCDNQAKAIQRVNQRRDLANRELCREEIISQMQTIRDRAIRDIEAIKVIGSPLWRTDKNKDLTLNSDGNVEIAIPIRHGTQPSVRYLAINPPNAAQGSSNQVGIDPVARPAGWTLVSMSVADNENAHSLKLTWGGVGTAAAETIFDLVARNACGPTLLRVIIRNTEA